MAPWGSKPRGRWSVRRGGRTQAVRAATVERAETRCEAVRALIPDFDKVENSEGGVIPKENATRNDLREARRSGNTSRSRQKR